MASLHVNPEAQTSISRPYRSKRARPCDLCRSRKVCCRIQTAPPCILCKKAGAECTFVERPSKRPKLWDEQPRDSGHPISGNEAHTAGDYVINREEIPPNVNSALPVQRMQNDGTGPPAGSSMSLTFDELGLDFNGLADQHSPGDSEELADLSNILSEADRTYFWNAADNYFLIQPPEANHGDVGLGINATENSDGLESSSPSRMQPSSFPQRHENGNLPCITSLDDQTSTNAQYFGLSGESDPYLLRHYRYDARGEFKFFKLSFRKAADDSDVSAQSTLQRVTDNAALSGDAVRDEARSNQLSVSKNDIPVHFKISANELAADIQEETLIRQGVTAQAARRELYDLVCAADGIRLIGLFLKYVFPLLPAISRSQLGITATKPMPTVSDLDRIPTHLLAAIYASSLIFCPYDDRLCVSNVYTRPSTAKIWRLVYEEIFREIHTPHLSVVQAALFYLHKPRTEASGAAADTPFHWSFMGVILGLSSSLALHLDCHDWLIPPWEKRLRRRLWWVIYVEEKWRSLLGGFPTLISNDQWDISDLTEDDFATDEDFPMDAASDTDQSLKQGNETCLHFRYLAKLSEIVEDVHKSFYTLRASRRMSRDFHLSITNAQPLRSRLKAWYSSLPASLQIRNKSAPDNLSSATLDFNSPLHLSYLTLEILLYRALLRPLGRRIAQIPLVPSRHQNDTAASQDSAGTTPPEITRQPNPVEAAPREMHEVAEAVILAAEDCAKITTGFVAGLDSRDFAGFWYSWSRIGFATMSNFTMLLLVQAPSYQHAVESKQILDNWRRTLRFQSKSFEQMNLGLLRLDAVHYSGIENLWIIDDHVKRVLHSS